MYRKLAALLCLLAPVPLVAQAPTAPVVTPRGVTNAFTRQPAPASVAPGGLIWIEGLNLGTAEGMSAPTIPWPLKLGDVEVLVNTRPAPVGYVSPGKIVAQVPLEVGAGLAQVVVRSNGASTRPARIQVVTPNFPSILTADGSGWGNPAGMTDAVLNLSVSGLGPTDPGVKSGEAGSTDTPVVPRAEIRAFVGGLPATASAVLSPDRVGEFNVKVDVPAGAVPGDVITLLANNRAANQVTFQSAGKATLLYVPFAQGTPEIRSVESADLRGTFVTASSARTSDGCYATWVFDLSKNASTQVNPCLTAANGNAPSPFVAVADSSVVGALIGPPSGDAASGISNKVALLSPIKDAMTVELPAAASALASAGGDLVAVMPGTPPSAVSINSDTGELTPLTNVNLGAAAGAGAGGANVPIALAIDLGGGVKNVISTRTQLAQGTSAVVVADDISAPKVAKVALLNNQNEVIGSKDFPDGWLPLLNPDPPVQGNPGGAAGGAVAAAARAAQKTTTFFDAQTRLYYVLGRKTDDSKQGFFAFSADSTPTAIRELPSGWFAASCTNTVRVLQLTLSRQIAIFGTNAVENTFKTPCLAVGYLVMDMGSTQAISAVKLQGEGQANVSANSGDLNDYLYATNPPRPISDTVYVLDGVGGQSFRFDPPASVAGFSNITEVPELSVLVGLATNQQRTPGDAGFVIFDIDQQQTRMLPTPEGFASVQLVAIMNATRKLVAKGIRTGATGSQFLIYDLQTGDLQMPANPPGVAFVGTLPAAATTPTPGQGGGGGNPGAGGTPQAPLVAQQANRKANTVAAICYDSDRKQTGVMVLRVN